MRVLTILEHLLTVILGVILGFLTAYHVSRGMEARTDSVEPCDWGAIVTNNIEITPFISVETNRVQSSPYCTKCHFHWASSGDSPILEPDFLKKSLEDGSLVFTNPCHGFTDPPRGTCTYPTRDVVTTNVRWIIRSSWATAGNVTGNNRNLTVSSHESR